VWKWLRPVVDGSTDVFPSVVRLLALGIAIGGAVPPNLTGQESPVDAKRSRVELRLGAIAFGAGDESCGDAHGLAGGVALRSLGRTFVQGSLDLIAASDPPCTSPAEVTSYHGTTVFVNGVPRLRSSLRVGAWAGRELEMGGLLFEPVLGAGFTRVRTLYVGEREWQGTWQPWTAARLTIRGVRSGIGARIEVGRNRLPKRYYVPGVVPGPTTDVGEAVRSFHVWSTTAEFGLAVPWGMRRPGRSPATELPVRLGVRVGIGSQNSGGQYCPGYVTLALGASAETRGTIFARGTLDVVSSARGACDVAVALGPGGEPLPVILSETTNDFAPRVGAWLGARIELESLELDGAGGATLSRSKTSYEEREDLAPDITWEPSIGLRVGVESPDAALRLELTVGRARIQRRVVFQGEPNRSSLAHEWKPFFEVGIASSLN
jgi:hypothetical protein